MAKKQSIYQNQHRIDTDEFLGNGIGSSYTGSSSKGYWLFKKKSLVKAKNYLITNLPCVFG